MTKLLEQAIKAAEALPPEMQDELARDLLEFFEDATRRQKLVAAITQQRHVVTTLAQSLDDLKAEERTLKLMAEHAETFKALSK